MCPQALPQDTQGGAWACALRLGVVHLPKMHLLTCTVGPAVRAGGSQVLGSQGGGGLEPRGGAGGEGRSPTGSGRWGPVRASAVSFLAGEYVIMIRDVTTPPFLGRTLPTAFKHLRVSSKGTGRQLHIPGEGPKAPN